MVDAPSTDPSFYEKMASDLRERMAKLEPAVREYGRLKTLLEMVTADPESNALSVDAYGTGPAPAPRTSTAARRGGGPRGYRATQVVDLLRAEPGLTRAQLADRLGIRVGYLYQLLPTLREKGFVDERDGSWFAA